MPIYYAILKLYNSVTLQYWVFLIFILGIILILALLINILSWIFFRHIQDQYSNIWDRTVPLLYFILFSICCISIQQGPFWGRFVVIGIIYLVFLPILYLWSVIRNWHQNEEKLISLRNPLIFLEIANGLVYPLIFGMYIIIIRYMRLDSSFNVYKFIGNLPLEYLPWVIVLLVYNIHIILILLEYIKKWRHHYWLNLMNITSKFNLTFMTNPIYAFLFKKLHKICYFIYVVISDHLLVFPHNNKNYQFTIITKLRYIIIKVFSYVFYKPFIIYIIMGLFFMLELYFNNGSLYYSIYILFLYPLIYLIMQFIFYFARYDIAYYFSFSDYLNTRWMVPHYPHVFWSYVSVGDMFPFIWNLNIFTKETQNKITANAFISEKKRQKISTLDPFSLRNAILFDKIMTKNNFFLRIAAHYRKFYQIRWFATFNTSPISNTITNVNVPIVSTIQYPLYLGLMINTNPYHKINLINNNWLFVNVLESNNLSQAISFPKNFYTNVPDNMITNMSYTHPYLITAIEENTILNFTQILQKYNIKASTWDLRNTSIDYNEFKRQSKPDVVLDFSSLLLTWGVSLDLKNEKHKGCGYNVLVVTTQKKYTAMLNAHFKEFLYRYPQKDPTIYVDFYRTLASKAHDIDIIDYWVRNLKLFHPSFVPPLNLPQNFNTQFLSQESKLKLLESTVNLEKHIPWANEIFGNSPYARWKSLIAQLDPTMFKAKVDEINSTPEVPSESSISDFLPNQNT